jgi:DNA cross-link repair 1A protein
LDTQHVWQGSAPCMLQVPYSEHSSFTELREFVAWLNPVRIIPHVNTDNGGPKATRMVLLLRGQDVS